MGSKVNVIAKSSILYIIATFIGQGCTFLSMMIFTRIMSQNDYGMYTTYYSLVSILVVLVGSNLYYPLNNAYVDFKSTILNFKKTVLILSTLVGLCVTCAIMLISHFFLPGIPYVYVGLALAHAYSFFVVNYQIFSSNMEGNYKRKIGLIIFPNLLQLVFAYTLVKACMGNALGARILGSTIGVGICAVVSYISILREKGKIEIRTYWSYAMKIACPSIVMSLSSMIMQQCDKVMITDLCGAEYTAVYSLIFYLGYALMAVEQAISPVWQAWIFRKLDENQLQNVKRVQKWYLLLMAILMTCLLLISTEVIKFVAPKSYWDFRLVPPFVFSACTMVLYGFYTILGMFYKRSGRVSACVLVAAGVNVCLNRLLIPVLGYTAAAYTTVISYLLLFCIIYLAIRRDVKGLLSGKIFAAFVIYCVLACIVYSQVWDHVMIRMLLLAILLAVVGVYFFYKRYELKSIISQ